MTSEEQRRGCAKAAPGAAGSEVVETQREKYISMPVRSHCSWRGTAYCKRSGFFSLLSKKPRSATTHQRSPARSFNRHSRLRGRAPH